MKDVTMICNYVAVILLTLASQSNYLYAMGMDPLHEAAAAKNGVAVRQLIDNGYDVNTADSDGRWPLHCAAAYGNAEVVQILIVNGADCNIKNKYYETPLHWAVKHKNIDTMRILIEIGADINATNCFHETPLHYAVESGHFYAIQLLIKNCADINSANFKNVTPRDYVSLVLKSAHCATQESRLARIEDEKKRLELMRTIVHNSLEGITKREKFEIIAYMLDHPDQIESIFLTIAMKSARSHY